MNNFLILILLLFIVSCSDAKLEGHWHLKKSTYQDYEDYFDEEATLDIEADTVIRNNLSHYRKVFSINKRDKKFEIVDHHRGGRNFNFELNEDTIQLTSVDNQVEYHGVRCVGDCCSKQYDSFVGEPLEIDLPIVTDTSFSKVHDIKGLLDKRLYLGIPKGGFQGYSTDPRLVVSGKFSSVKDLSIIIEKTKIKLPEKFRDKIQYSLYPDKDVRLEFIIPLLKEFERLGYTKINLAVRENTDLSKEFKIRLFEINLEDLTAFDPLQNIAQYVESISK